MIGRCTGSSWESIPAKGNETLIENGNLTGIKLVNVGFRGKPFAA